MLPVNILAFGGGVDSSTLLAIDLNRVKAALILNISLDKLNGLFPPLDAAVFSNPGAEFTETYKNVDYARSQCEKAGLLFDITAHKETITEWLGRNGNVPLLPGAKHICSLKFKGQVLQKWAKFEYGDDRHISWAIGIESDEGHRCKRYQPAIDDMQTSYFPLKALGMNRGACVAMLRALGWPPVRKSSCFFCPYMKEHEIKELFIDFPELWDQAKTIENQFRKTSPIKHQAWLDAGKPVDKSGRCRPGHWKQDYWATGARLYAKSHKGKRRSLAEWEAIFLANPLPAAA